MMRSIYIKVDKMHIPLNYFTTKNKLLPAHCTKCSVAMNSELLGHLNRY